MAIDNSIYFKQQVADLGGSFEKGMRLGDLMKKRKKENAISQAYKDNLVTNPDGTSSVNEQGVISQLNRGGYGQEGYALGKQFEQDRLAKQENEYKALTRKNSFISSAAYTALNNPNLYPQIRNDLIKSGMVSAEEMPEQFDPNFIQSAISRGQSLQDQLDQSWKQKQFDYTYQKDSADQALKKQYYDNQLKQQAFDNKVKLDSLSNQKNEGQRKVDTEFAKDYNDWTSGGSDMARSEINKLQGVIENIKSGKVSTGGLTGMFPDRVTSNSVLQARADVSSTIMNSLRAILGAAFTEKEGERVINNTWNESDSTENNLARLERLVGDLQSQAMAKDQKSNFFEQTGGTLKGFTPNIYKSQMNKGSQKISPNEMNEAFKWAKENPNDPRAKEIMSRIGGK